eukprot:CAMPEP_0117001212 /NCGR_PEP_ID=MMETSP0472-20121206/3285_1 /TAXON_ID=693140 ORGANISM="Tiarina fusus, Strain LIS" /NCGR_SAMPLE_ID=MMETSP0472 /ASSEMBLY_ACC=CAM_ASM_000603 /LENGTH=201 /DNA_ID=CAMNT_0004701141 /DNA_START=56 /DNA_END=661 /DNA_ORIENTATION=-
MTPSSYPTSTKAEGPPVPDEFVCPLTLSIMRDPVMDTYGHNFEKSAIMAWIYEGNTTCPLTRRKLKPRYLAHNTTLKHEIDEWKRENNVPDDRSISDDKEGQDDRVVIGIVDIGRQQRNSKQSSNARSKRSSKEKNTRLDVVARLQQLETAKSSSKKTKEKEALAEKFLKSLNGEQLAALDMICDIHAGCDTALLAERYLS